MLPSVAVRHCQISPHYLINGTIFKNRVIEFKMCVLISLQLLPKTSLIPRIIQQGITNVPKSSHKVPVIFYVLLTVHIDTSV